MKRGPWTLARDDSGDREGWWLTKLGSDALFPKWEQFIPEDDMLALHRLLAAMKWPSPRKTPKPWRLKPDAQMLAARKRPHKFEEAHDDPAGSDHCWDCLLPRGHKVHRG